MCDMSKVKPILRKTGANDAFAVRTPRRDHVDIPLTRRAERSATSASPLPLKFPFGLSSAALRQSLVILVISLFARDCFTPAHFSPYSVCDYAASEEPHNVLVGPEKNWCCRLTPPQLH